MDAYGSTPPNPLKLLKKKLRKSRNLPKLPMIFQNLPAIQNPLWQQSFRTQPDKLQPDKTYRQSFSIAENKSLGAGHLQISTRPFALFLFHRYHAGRRGSSGIRFIQSLCRGRRKNKLSSGRHPHLVRYFFQRR